MEQVSTHAIAGSANERTTENVALRRRFLLALLISTWVPLVFFTLIAPSAGQSNSLSAIRTVFLFLGTAHVPATLLFYTDPEFSAIRKSHPLRYIYVPLLLIVATGLLFAFASLTIQAFALLLFWSWQAFHYGRQNIGIYAFASISETGRAPRKAEKIAIEAGTILAILGTFKILGSFVAPTYLHQMFEYLYRFGFAAFFLVVVFSVIVYAKYFQDTSPLKTVFFFTTVLFFAPVFLSTDNNIAFLSYAIAHGLQYIIFMSVISATAPHVKERGLPYKSIGLFLVFLLIVGLVFWRINDLREIEVVKSTWSYARVADFLFGAVLGATMAHFVVDANAWRLSMERQRSYITKRFRFVFER